MQLCTKSPAAAAGSGRRLSALGLAALWLFLLGLGSTAALGHGEDATPEEEAWEKAMEAAQAAGTDGDLKQMEVQLKEAMKYAEKFEANDMRLALTLNNLGWIYQNQGKFAEAEPLSKRVLAIVEKSLEPENPTVARALENYALLLRKLKRDSEAVKVEARLQAVRAKASEKEPPSDAHHGHE